MNGLEHVRLTLPRVLEAEHMVLVKPCVCGGTVRADLRFPTEGVRNHNRSTRHMDWRRATGKYDE